jgi:hypothetical protein
MSPKSLKEQYDIVTSSLTWKEISDLGKYRLMYNKADGLHYICRTDINIPICVKLTEGNIEEMLSSDEQDPEEITSVNDHISKFLDRITQDTKDHLKTDTDERGYHKVFVNDLYSTFDNFEIYLHPSNKLTMLVPNSYIKFEFRYIEDKNIPTKDCVIDLLSARYCPDINMQLPGIIIHDRVKVTSLYHLVEIVYTTLAEEAVEKFNKLNRLDGKNR